MPDRPLEGVRVLDITNVYAGPTSGRILADLGADVIHVEALQRIDGVRLLILAENDAGDEDSYWERGGYFIKRNLGKRDITLDLTRPDGQQQARGLIAACDVVVESFAPRVLRGFGLDYAAVRELRPDIIMISLSGYGQSGPCRDWIAYGMGLEPASGLSQLTGYAGGPPKRSGISLTDPLSGILGAAAVLTALHYRRRTGRGQSIDLSEQEGAIGLAGDALLDLQMNGRTWERTGNRDRVALPQGCYPCRGEDEWLAISVADDAEWERLCDAAGHPEWKADARFADLLVRLEHEDALDEAISGWTRSLEKSAAMALLQAAGVKAAAVLNARDLLFDEHLRARGLFQVVDHPVVGPRPYPRQLPVQFSDFEAGALGPAPTLGQHNAEVLGGLLGLDAEELKRLEAELITGNRPVPVAGLTFPVLRHLTRHPTDDLLAEGAFKQVDADYRERLGL